MAENIILIITAILAALFIIRTIIKIAKGEDPCMFCKSCGDDKQDSCCSLKNEKEKQEKETKKD